MTFESDPKLASDLRQAVAKAWQAEAEEDEQLTAVYDRRRLNLTDLAKEMVNKGSRVAVEFDGHSFSGVVVGGGADHVTIQGAGLKADVMIDVGYWSVVPTARGETKPGVATDETILARLAEHADQRNTVRLAVTGGDLVIGMVIVVAEDHIELEDADNRHVYVPMSIVRAVIRSTDYQ